MLPPANAGNSIQPTPLNTEQHARQHMHIGQVQVWEECATLGANNSKMVRA